MAETLTWVDVDGVEHPLEPAGNVKVIEGVDGRFMPETELITDRIPSAPGGRVRDVRHEPRVVVLPIWLQATDDTSLRAAVRAWLHRFNAIRGDGRLRVTAPGGDQRELRKVRYTDGLGIHEGSSERTVGLQRARLVLEAFDPYWYDVTATVVSFTLGSTPATFFPFFPLRLTSSEVFADAVVVNGGDVEAWPVWTITGPGSSISLINLTTGKTLALSTTLAGGETITIDTRPGAKTVAADDGTNLFPDLSAASQLWPLEPGSNSVAVGVASATDDSQVDLSYHRRYLGT